MLNFYSRGLTELFNLCISLCHVFRRFKPRDGTMYFGGLFLGVHENEHCLSVITPVSNL